VKHTDNDDDDDDDDDDDTDADHHALISHRRLPISGQGG